MHQILGKSRLAKIEKLSRPMGFGTSQRAAKQTGVKLSRLEDGNRLIIFPGTKPEERSALLSANWRDIELDKNASRMKKGHGLVFTAKARLPNGRTIKVRVKPIRKHYSTTHEARMLLFLKSKGFEVEEPLGILADRKRNERYIITRFIEGLSYDEKEAVAAAKKRLSRLMIDPVDFDTHGKANYVFAQGKGGKPVLHLIDVEHYSSTDQKSKLHTSKMVAK